MLGFFPNPSPCSTVSFHLWNSALVPHPVVLLHTLAFTVQLHRMPFYICTGAGMCICSAYNRDNPDAHRLRASFRMLSLSCNSDPAKLAPPTDLPSARLSYLLALRPSIFLFSKLCSPGAGLTGLSPFPPCPLSISSFWDPCDSPHPPRLREDWLLPLFWTTSHLSRTLDSARATVTRSFFLIPSLSSLDLPSR